AAGHRLGRDGAVQLLVEQRRDHEPGPRPGSRQLLGHGNRYQRLHGDRVDDALFHQCRLRRLNERARGPVPPHPRFAGYPAAGPLDEEFVFLMPQFPMYHQQEHHRLNIAVRYRYVRGIANDRYPDYQWPMRDIEQFLSHYPRPMDYWEIVNKHMTQMLLRKYP